MNFEDEDLDFDLDFFEDETDECDLVGQKLYSILNRLSVSTKLSAKVNNILTHFISEDDLNKSELFTNLIKQFIDILDDFENEYLNK